MFIALLVLGLATFIGYVWLAIVMFKRHVIWGSVFILPVAVGFVAGFSGSPVMLMVANGLSIVSFLVGIIFAIMNWSLAKKAFLLYLLPSIAIGGIVASEMFSLMQTPEVVAIQEKLYKGEISQLDAQQRMQKIMQQKFIDRYFNSGAATISDDDLMTPEEQRIESLREELRIKNDAARASQEYADEQAKQVEIKEEQLRKVNIFSPIKISQVKNYVGKKLRIVSFDGVERQGILESAGFDRLTLNRKLAGGQFNFDILIKDIKTLEVQKTVLK